MSAHPQPKVYLPHRQPDPGATSNNLIHQLIHVINRHETMKYKPYLLHQHALHAVLEQYQMHNIRRCGEFRISL